MDTAQNPGRRRLRRIGGAAMTALLLTLLLTAIPVSAAPWTVSITPTAHGTFATFAVTSNVPAQFVLSASTGPFIGGNTPTFANVTSATFSWGKMTNWPTHLLDFTPETVYNYVLKATDANNNTTYRWGSFKTKARQITVHFNDIHVTDDSDGGFNGAGDLTFFFKVNGAWDASLKYGEVSVSSGTTVHPNRTKVVNNAPATLTFAVQGKDDDCGGFGLCTYGLGPMSTDHGSTSQLDWATAKSGSIAIDQDFWSEEFSAPFTISTTTYELQFSVSGTYSVKYV